MSWREPPGMVCTPPLGAGSAEEAGAGEGALVGVAAEAAVRIVPGIAQLPVPRDPQRGAGTPCRPFRVDRLLFHGQKWWIPRALVARQQLSTRISASL